MPLETLPGAPRARFLGGYVYDAETDKLVQANRCPIELSLRRVCRTIAIETYDYPLTLNTITFSTAYRRDWRKQAAMVEFITTYHFRLLSALLERLRHCLTPDLYETPPTQHDSRYMSVAAKDISLTIGAETRHPEYNVDLHANDYMLDFKAGRGIKNNGGDLTRPSGRDNNISSNRVYTSLLQQIANRNPEKFRDGIDDVLPGWAESKASPASDFFELGFDFWAIPSMRETVDMVKELQLEERWDQLDLWRYSEYGKEGYTGIRGCATELEFFPTENKSIIEPEEGIPGPHQVHYPWASRIISIFIMHTLEALEEGLPPNSYCLILDGEPEVNHATETFRYLMDRKIAWTTANTDCVAQGVLASPKSKNYPFQTCFSTSEPVAVHDSGSIIQCNFTLDQPWDYNAIAGDKGKTIKRWKSVNAVERDYGDDQDGLFDVSNGKVDWMQIKGEYFKMKPRSDLSEGEIRALNSGGLHE
ncbi:hypothetical protein FPCIR_3269 [Fusarium pseudocircinatum]|uniref:Uncharacterized protein n=1 Tax=Fusarium pseudocircinatum TaxID=56676 RepID=A0A8H5UT68_9HYPO|nr:hypothetical protein FPCIR_3269 [Fusarium pseudocircinatum]